MVTGILNRIDQIKERYAHLGPDFALGGDGRAALDRLWDAAYAMLKTDHMRYSYQVASQPVADAFFRMWQREIGEPEGVRPDGGVYTMPVCSSVRDTAPKFFQEKGLNLDIQNRIYPMRMTGSYMASVLCKSRYYKTPQQVYDEMCGDIPGDGAQVKAVKRDVEAALEKLRDSTANN